MQPSKPEIPNLSSGVAHFVGFSCVACVVLSYYFGAQHTLTTLKTQTTSRIEIIQDKLAESTSIRVSHAKSLQELQRLREKIKVVNEKVPVSPKDGEFLADISRLARMHGVRIDDFRQDSPKDQDEVASITVSVNGVSNYQGLCEFLHAVNDLPRIALLTHLKLEATPTQEDYPLEVRYALYYTPSSQL